MYIYKIINIVCAIFEKIQYPILSYFAHIENENYIGNLI